MTRQSFFPSHTSCSPEAFFRSRFARCRDWLSINYSGSLLKFLRCCSPVCGGALGKFRKWWLRQLFSPSRRSLAKQYVLNSIRRQNNDGQAWRPVAKRTPASAGLCLSLRVLWAGRDGEAFGPAGFRLAPVANLVIEPAHHFANHKLVRRAVQVSFREIAP